MAKSLWEQRWEDLRDAGVTREQALKVYDVLEDARAHHSQMLADYSLAALERTYAKEGADEDA